VELLTANNNADLLIHQAIEFDVNNVVICNEDKYRQVADALEPHYIKVFAGMSSVCDLAGGSNIDIVLTSMVGFSGLESTIAAVKAGKTIALANKETLVAAGHIVMDLASKHRSRILPVDSEHSALFQCLMGSAVADTEKIHLTASGGPFRTWKREDIAKATKAQALEKLCEVLGLTRENVLAMGDGDNDMPMIQFAGIGVAMENGEEHIRQAADIIADDCNDFGAAKILEQIIACKK
jgi:1-deoxy-D-xylulose-5-phosphate reductoisomerase